MSKEAIEMLRSMSAGARHHGDEEVAKRAERCAASVEELQKQNEQWRERAALEARRVLRNGGKALKLERQVEEKDKEIEKLRQRLEASRSAVNYWHRRAKAATEEVATRNSAEAEIERLREQVRITEHKARNLADEVGTLREVNTGLGIENQALQAEEE